MNIAIIGAGLIGYKRAANLPKTVKISAVCDIVRERAKQFAQKYSCNFTTDWQEAISNPQVEAVIISTTNNLLAPIASKAIEKGKHVLIEKPGGRNSTDFRKVISAHRKNPVVVQIGYNHRFHPAIIRAKEIVDSKNFGPVLFIRGRYGHGGRLGYEKEWRFNPKISGGGELLDQGSHLIDLSNYFIGPSNQVTGYTQRMFWQSPLEDAGFFILRSQKKQISHFSVTACEWKNIFVLEIILKTAKIQINGLGGSYDHETLTFYKMKPEMGPPEVKEFKFENDDRSWYRKNEVFIRRIQKKDFSDKSIKESLYVLETVKKIYQLNKKGEV
ncbi:Gfo/Idh/MocA family oxidoreductase [Candidatus Microgenomates bacterium]|nr:Gfo/Idh/MocA family oxidoreductase [Candidatus Microgenomates bacterium]